MRSILFASLIFTIYGLNKGSENELNPYTDKKTAFIDSLIKHSTLEQKIGQLFFVPVKGEFLSQDDHSYKEISDLIIKDHIGGIIFMRGDIYGQAVLTNKLQNLKE